MLSSESTELLRFGEGCSNFPEDVDGSIGRGVMGLSERGELSGEGGETCSTPVTTSPLQCSGSVHSDHYFPQGGGQGAQMQP